MSSWWNVNGTRTWKANPSPSDPFAEYASYAALPSAGMQDGDTAYTTDTRTRWQYVGTRGGVAVNMWLPHDEVRYSGGCVLTTTGSYPVYIDTVAGDTKTALAARGWTITEAGGAVTDEAGGLQLTSAGGDSSQVDVVAQFTMPARVLLVVEANVTSTNGTANYSSAVIDLNGATLRQTLSLSQAATANRYCFASSSSTMISGAGPTLSAYDRFFVFGGDGTDLVGWPAAKTTSPTPSIAALSSALPSSSGVTNRLVIRVGTQSTCTVIIKRLFLLETVP